MTFEAAAYILRIVEHIADIGHLIIQIIQQVADLGRKALARHELHVVTRILRRIAYEALHYCVALAEHLLGLDILLGTALGNLPYGVELPGRCRLLRLRHKPRI